MNKDNDTLIGALAKALPELDGAKKNKANPHFKSKYADLAAVIDALAPIREHGLWYRQHSHENADGVTVETFYIHVSGEQLSAGTLFMPAMKRDPQGFGSALSYARRYALQMAFGVPTEDDDGNAAVASMSRQEPKQEPKRGLDGPYTSKDALKKAFIALRSEVNRCGDDDTLECLLATDDAKKLIAQCDRDAPHLLHGNDPNAPEWIGLYAEIQRLRDNFQLENVR